MDPLEKANTSQSLGRIGVIWYETLWHSGRFKPLKKAFDLLKGVIYSLILIRRHKAKKIYSEGFPGAIIGHFLSKLSGMPHIIHTFEPHADYMVEAGVWNKSNWEYRLLKKLEIPVGNHATHIITATKGYRKRLLEKGIKSEIRVIPSCVDTSFYKYLPEKRVELRSTFGLTNEHIVIAYLGKLGGMYMDRELFEFFASCLRDGKDRFFFFLFTNESSDKIEASLRDWGIPLSKIFYKYLQKDEVPSYLSAADIGFCGIRAIKSRRFSSPIKNGEYWACGLPILIPEGISDDYIHASEEQIGLTFKNTSEIDLKVLESLKRIDRRIIEKKSFALRGLENYRQSYLEVFDVIH